MTDPSSFKRTLFTRKQIDERVFSLGQQISQDYAGKDLVVVGVLKGSLYFLADLTRCIDVPLKLDFISIGVYQGVTNRTGVVRIIKDLDFDVTGKHVLIVEDIIRTGLTTGYLVKNIEGRCPASVKVCTLLQNPDQLLLNIPIAYLGFTVSEAWLAGYGMDIGEKWRNLPYIAEVERTKQ
jgi:hypoxanthine phosphoribosyltransferase